MKMKRYILPVLATFAALTSAANVKGLDAAPVAAFKLTAADSASLSLKKIIQAAPSDDKVTLLDFHYCQDPQMAIRPGNGEFVENSAAIKLPKEWQQNYIGAKITKVTICAGFNGSDYTNHITDVTVFLNRDIFTQDPFYKQEGRMERINRKWNDIELKTPHVIDGTSDLYVGFTVIRPSMNDAPFVVDVQPNTSGCTFWANYEYDGERVWEDISGTYGSVCMRLTIEGDDLPQNDVTLTNLSIPTYAAYGSKFPGSFMVTNHGVNPVNSVTVQASVGNEQPQSMEVKLPRDVQYNESFAITCDNLVCNEEGAAVPIVMSVTKVNGVDDSYPGDNTLTGSVICFREGHGFKRRFVFEEGTGLWCGYCPRGAYSMDYMLEKYPDGSFIGIAAHQGDVMQINTLDADGKSQLDFNHGYGNQFTMVGAYPHARYNRVAAYGTDIPSASYVEETYKQVTAIPATADVDFNLYINEEKDAIIVDGITQFSIPSETDYRVVYILLEDGLGPFPQSNYFSGSGRTDVGPWADMANPAMVEFNHVARYVTSYYGESGTVPSSVEPDEKYPHTAVIPIANLMLKNLDKASVVGILVNHDTGEVENARLVHCSSDLPVAAGVGDVQAEGEGAPVWYTIQGVRVAQPSAPGIYVKVAGGRSSKVIVR